MYRKILICYRSTAQKFISLQRSSTKEQVEYLICSSKKLFVLDDLEIPHNFAGNNNLKNIYNMLQKRFKEVNSSSFSSKCADVNQNVKRTTNAKYANVHTTLANKEQYLLTLKSWRVKLWMITIYWITRLLHGLQ